MCGIMDTGDTFRFVGSFSFSSPYLITLVYQLENFSFVSSFSAFIASSASTERCGPWYSAASMCSTVKSYPHSA